MPSPISPPRAYKKPPIIEAVIELRLAEAIDWAAVTAAAEKIKGAYVVDETESQVEAQFQAEGSAIRQSQFGRKLSTIDRSETVVLRVNAFVGGQLAPYPGWEIFASRVRADMEKVKRTYFRQAYAQVWVRFINRIDVPIVDGNAIRGEDYLKLTPNLPEIGVGPLTAFTMQVERSLGVGQIIARLATATVTTPVPNAIGLLLDIDLVWAKAAPKTFTDLWKQIGEMRHLKNHVFEECITDATRELLS